MRITINLILLATLTLYTYLFAADWVRQKNSDAETQVFFQKVIADTRRDLLSGKIPGLRAQWVKLSTQSTEPVDNCVKTPR